MSANSSASRHSRSSSCTSACSSTAISSASRRSGRSERSVSSRRATSRVRERAQADNCVAPPPGELVARLGRCDAGALVFGVARSNGDVASIFAVDAEATQCDSLNHRGGPIDLSPEWGRVQRDTELFSATEGASQMGLVKDFRDSGAVDEGAVPVNISYDIIRQFSAQLYTTPRKAIEELICNSYDAGAGECYVGLPQSAKEPLVVLDNGKSMDFDGIRALWQVAKSPKVTKDSQPRVANGRMQIGKFGVGKLAAFALGERLTHVACVKGTVRIISVGQRDIRDKAGGKAPSFDVYKLPLKEAHALLTPLLGQLPKPWEKKWASWTLAIV